MPLVGVTEAVPVADKQEDGVDAVFPVSDPVLVIATVCVVLQLPLVILTVYVPADKPVAVCVI